MYTLYTLRNYAYETSVNGCIPCILWFTFNGGYTFISDMSTSQVCCFIHMYTLFHCTSHISFVSLHLASSPSLSHKRNKVYLHSHVNASFWNKCQMTILLLTQQASYKDVLAGKIEISISSVEIFCLFAEFSGIDCWYFRTLSCI